MVPPMYDIKYRVH